MSFQSSEATAVRRDEASAPSDPRPVRKPRPRLAGFAYRGRHAYHLVMAVKARSDIFTDVEFGNWCVSQLVTSSIATGFEVLAYCFMPDHLHLLIQGSTDSAYLIRFVQNFKQRTAFPFKQASGEQLWQQSYFDRVLRDDEQLESVADYIFENPVAAGLCTDAWAYRLSGGEYFDWALTDRAKAPSLHGPLSSGKQR